MGPVGQPRRARGPPLRLHFGPPLRLHFLGPAFSGALFSRTPLCVVDYHSSLPPHPLPSFIYMSLSLPLYGAVLAMRRAAASERMSDWRELISRMLQTDEAQRPSVDDVGHAAAALPASQNLEGTSAAAKASLSQPPGANSGVGATSQHHQTSYAPMAAAYATPPLPPVPSRPSQPMATEVKHNELVLLWEPPPASDEVDTFQVLAQTSGSGGFQSLLADTHSSHPIVRLDALSERTWYEFKVLALNASGSSAASAASLPVQTLKAPVPAAVIAAKHAAAAKAAALSADRQQRSPQPSSREDGHRAAAEESEALARHGAQYAQCKRDLVAWEGRFEQSFGRAPTENDKSADPGYQTLLARYKKLKHAKRKLERQPDGVPNSSTELAPGSPRGRILTSPVPPNILLATCTQERQSPFAPCACVANGLDTDSWPGHGGDHGCGGDSSFAAGADTSFAKQSRDGRGGKALDAADPNKDFHEAVHDTRPQDSRGSSSAITTGARRRICDGSPTPSAVSTRGDRTTTTSSAEMHSAVNVPPARPKTPQSKGTTGKQRGNSKHVRSKRDLNRPGFAETPASTHTLSPEPKMVVKASASHLSITHGRVSAAGSSAMLGWEEETFE